PKQNARQATKDDFRPAREPKLPKPVVPATAGRQISASQAHASAASRPTAHASAPAKKQRLFANPSRRNNRSAAAGTGQLSGSALDGGEVFRVYFSRVFRLSPDDVVLK